MQKTDRVHFLTGRGKLYRRDNNIVFTATDENGVENGVPKALPINAIDELYITANIETDTNTLCFLADNNTLVHLFTHTGAHRGNIYPNTPNAVNKSGESLRHEPRGRKVHFAQRTNGPAEPKPESSETLFFDQATELKNIRRTGPIS